MAVSRLRQSVRASAIGESGHSYNGLNFSAFNHRRNVCFTPIAAIRVKSLKRSACDTKQTLS